jgi:phage shock protein A
VDIAPSRPHVLGVDDKKSDGPLIAAFNAAADEMAKSTRSMRVQQAAAPVGEASFSERLRTAREKLEELERNVKALAKMRDDEAANADEWETRAMVSVRNGNDDLARESLLRQREHEILHRLFAREHDATVKVVALLREFLAELEAKSQPVAAAKSTS